MAWKRAINGKYFSVAQRRRMVELVVVDGLTQAAVCDRVGITEPALRNNIDKFKTQVAKVEAKVKAKLAAAPPEPSTEQTRERVRYLEWVATGLLRRIGQASYVDRLIADIRDGRLG